MERHFFSVRKCWNFIKFKASQLGKFWSEKNEIFILYLSKHKEKFSKYNIELKGPYIFFSILIFIQVWKNKCMDRFDLYIGCMFLTPAV